MFTTTFLKTAAVAGVLSMASLTAASAATTIEADEGYVSAGGVVTPSTGTYQYDYEATEDLSIADFALSAVGHSSDITKIRASFIPDNGESTVLEAFGTGSNVFGGGFLSGLMLSAGDTFSIVFEVLSGQSINRNVGVQVSFDTMAPVPVPAAGGLLLSALAAAGFAARRKKKAA